MRVSSEVRFVSAHIFLVYTLHTICTDGIQIYCDDILPCHHLCLILCYCTYARMMSVEKNRCFVTSRVFELRRMRVRCLASGDAHGKDIAGVWNRYESRGCFLFFTTSEINWLIDNNGAYNRKSSRIMIRRPFAHNKRVTWTYIKGVESSG